MRVFVCSPLRGPDGQPSEANIALARRLMKAVFDAGHQPFVPHLLYPQVLTENAADIHRAFKANFAFLDVCEEAWVYARKIEECSSGMTQEVQYAQRPIHGDTWPKQATVVWMPPSFEEVERALREEQAKLAMDAGTCSRCGHVAMLNSQGLCLKCFAGGTPA